MKISVIAIFYNSEQYVNQCVESILMQKNVDLEIITVDDCSTDNTLKILKNYSSKHSNIHVIHHNTNQGISAARNSGLSNVTGDAFFLIDGDDYLPSPCALASLAKHFTNDVDWIQGTYQKCDENGRILGLISFKDATYTNNDSICKNFDSLNFFYTHNKLINSKYKTFKFKPACYHEDRIWIASQFHSLNRIISISKPTYNYVMHKGQTSSKSRSTQLYINSGMSLMRIMSKCPQCWKTLMDTFQIVDIEKPLYLWQRDRIFRKKITRELKQINTTTISTKYFPRFNRLIHSLIQINAPDFIINYISIMYIRLMRLINHQI